MKTVIIDGREIPVTICPPGSASLPFHLIDAEEDFSHPKDLSAPCEDDVEVTCPYVDGNPAKEEHDPFFSRPLRFGGFWET